MDIIPLTKQFIRIRSYVNKECNEKRIADFIYDYLKTKSALIVKRQRVEGDRYNIIAFTSQCSTKKGFMVETLFIDHMDTVEPKKGWDMDQFEGIEKEGKLYGLGACDTKGNLAVLMKVAEKVKGGKIMFLFYCDEEYDFKGMKRFVQEYEKKLRVKRIVSADGSSLQIRSCCRGLIEMDVEIYGKTGHSANPKNGNNAILLFMKAVEKIDKKLNEQRENGLGRPTLNLSYIRGGLMKGTDNDGVVLGKNGNNIADYVEATIELRTTPRVDLKWVAKKFSALCRTSGLAFSIKTIRHNLPSWKCDRKKLHFLVEAIRKTGNDIAFVDAGMTGYVDIAMLAQTFDAICCTVGARGGNTHGANEYVEVASLETLYHILASIA